MKTLAGEKDNPHVSISYYRLAKCLGMDASTTLRKQIDLALSELKGTRLVWLDEAGKETASCNLLSVAEPSPDGGRKALRISLCPLLSSPDVRSSALIDMNEARSLKHRASILLHGWLSSRALSGRQTTAAVPDLLEGVIWPELGENQSSTRRMRKHALLNKILPDLVGAGWKADVDSEKEKIRFRRPMLPEQAYSEPARERYSYRIFWSDEDRGYLAVCDQFPGLSCAEAKPEKALNRIVRLLSEHAEDCPHA